MGLASKLAAAQAASGGLPGQFPPPQQGQPPVGQKPPYPGAASYAPYPGGNNAQQQNAQAYGQQPSAYPPQGQQQQYGAPPPGQQQYGAPPPGQQQYGAPPPGGPADPREVSSYKKLLETVISEKGLERFIPFNDPKLDQIAQRAPAQIAQLCSRWNVPKEIASDIVKLALFDIIIYIDNSGSMRFEDGGDRLDDLRLILNRVAYAATLFDDDGISLRFMNYKPGPYDTVRLDNIKTEQEILELVGTVQQPGKVQFQGLTPLGTELRNQVIEPLIMHKVASNQLRKPILVITITDGQPAGESKGTLENVIGDALQRIGKYDQLGERPLSFEFAQVGNDLKAREFLAELDAHPRIGDFVDCTSNFENEQDEMMKTTGQTLTPDAWLVKLLLGAIDKSYDNSDEKRPPQGQIGPGQQQYGAPPQGYPPPQQQQGYPPQQSGGYRPQGPPSGSYPPQGPPGYPPQQPSYPPQQPHGYPPQQQGGYPPQGQQGGHSPYPPQQQGGHSPYPPQQQQGGYNRPPPGQPGYPPQPPR